VARIESLGGLLARIDQFSVAHDPDEREASGRVADRVSPRFGPPSNFCLYCADYKHIMSTQIMDKCVSDLAASSHGFKAIGAFALITQVSLFALLPLLTACSNSQASAPPPPTIEVAKVVEKNVRDWDEYTGRLQAIDYVDIRPRIAGSIDRVAFKEGQVVKRGDLLFEIDPRPYQAEADRTHADMLRAKSRLELAQIQLVRVQKLKESGAVSGELFDQRQSEEQQAEADMAAAKAAYAASALNLSFTRITSPISGRTSRAEVTRGNLVSGGVNVPRDSATLLTSVVSIDPIYLYFECDEASYLRYERAAQGGQRAAAGVDGTPVQLALVDEQGYPHSGSIDFVDNQLNQRTGTVRLRAVFPNKDGLLKSGLYAHIRLLAGNEHPALLVNDVAVGTDQSNRFVLVLGKDNKIEPRVVKLGRMVDGMRVIRNGLAPGDKIVIRGLQRARPGTTVTPQVVPMETAPAIGDATSAGKVR